MRESCRCGATRYSALATSTLRPAQNEAVLAFTRANAEQAMLCDEHGQYGNTAKVELECRVDVRDVFGGAGFPAVGADGRYR